MADSRWQIFAVLYLVINDIIITSLLLLKIIFVLANFLNLSKTVGFKSVFALYLVWEKFGFCQSIQQYDVIMTSDDVIMSIKSCPEVGNDEKIILCGFGGRSVSVFEVIEGASQSFPSGRLPSRSWILNCLICFLRNKRRCSHLTSWGRRQVDAHARWKSKRSLTAASRSPLIA